MPFKTPLEAAIAHLIAKGVIKGQADVSRDLKLKSRSTVSSYANGKLPVSFKFQTLFENKYNVKLSDFEAQSGKGKALHAVAATAGSEDIKNSEVLPILNKNAGNAEKLDQLLRAMQQQSGQIQELNQKVNGIAQQQTMTFAVDGEFQRFVISRLDKTLDADTELEAQMQRAYDKLRLLRSRGIQTV